MCVGLGCGKKDSASGEVPQSGGKSSPSPHTNGIPDAWSHKELLDHLNKNGLKLRQIPTIKGSFSGPAAIFVPEKSAHKDDSHFDYDKEAPDMAYCRVHKTTQEAKDKIGAAGKGFASGRFVFFGDPVLLSKIKAVLP